MFAHEISTHVLRYENGKKRKGSIFADGTSYSMETEEGLAISNEELAGALELLTKVHDYPKFKEVLTNMQM